MLFVSDRHLLKWRQSLRGVEWVEWHTRSSWSHWSLLTRTACHTHTQWSTFQLFQFLQNPLFRGIHPHMGVHLEPCSSWEGGTSGIRGVRSPPLTVGVGVEFNTQTSRVSVSLDADPALSSSADKYSVVVQYIVQSEQCRVQWSALYRIGGC